MSSAAKTISEKILSTKSGTDAHAGDIVVCRVDRLLGTDAATPMAIDYFERMGGTAVFDAQRILLALDHYAPPSSPETEGYHRAVRAFAARFGIALHDVGDGISHQILAESGLALPGDLIVGADSHTVTCGALNAFATGIGSSDLAAAMISGQVWLKVPASIRVRLRGQLPSGVAAKDLVLALVDEIGADGAAYQALEFCGPALAGLDLDDRLVIANMSVEMGAKVGIFPADEVTDAYLDACVDAGRDAGGGIRRGVRLDVRRKTAVAPSVPVDADPGANYSREIELDVSSLSPLIALPHSPDNVVPVGEAAGTPVHMVFLGTCTGGRVADFHRALEVLEAGNGIAAGVQVVVTPASGEVYEELLADGTIDKLAAMGATITTPGCGPCCGTAGPIPSDGMNVISTANRNFKARMGNATAAIFLASPATCAAAAVAGRVVDPRRLEPEEG